MIDYDKAREFKLNIEVPVQLYGEYYGVTPESIEKYLENRFHNYEDGRYPYLIEMFKDTLNKMLQNAISESIYWSLEEKYRGEMVPQKNGSIARFIVEREKLGDIVGGWINEGIKVKIL